MESQQEKSNDKAIPLGQRILEKPFLLLALGMLVMVAFYTFWGILEIYTLPKAPLP